MAGRPTITLRERGPDDFQLVADLYNRSNPSEPDLTADMIRWAVGHADPERPLVERVAEHGGAAVGAGILRGIPARSGLMMGLDVVPEARRQGIGSALFAALLDEVRPTTYSIWTVASEAQPDSVRFLERRGFRERDRFFESVLDLATFDFDAYAAQRQAAIDRGLRFTTVAAEDSPELRRRVHRLSDLIDRDVPSVEPFTPVSHEQWLAQWFDAPSARPDLMVLVMDGDEPVAVSTIGWPEGSAAYNWITGVLRDYRGRGLAKAAKAEAMRLARGAGLTEIRTDNHVRNAPMLAINEQMGYRREPVYIEFVRDP